MAKAVKKSKADDLSYIQEPLRPLAIDIGKLNLDPTNAREHDRESIEAIKSSLGRFGQDQLLVVQKKGMVVRKGNGRLVAARELGWTKIAAIVVDETDIEAVARAVADNRSAELSKWSPERLGSALALLRDSSSASPADVGFSDREAERLIEFARNVSRIRDADASGPAEEKPEAAATGEAGEVPHRQPESEFVAVVFPMQPAHRDALMKRLQELKSQRGLSTASEALLVAMGII